MTKYSEFTDGFIGNKDFINLSKEEAKKKYNELLIEYPNWAEIMKRMKKMVFIEDIKKGEHISILDGELNGEKIRLLSKKKDNQQDKNLIVPHSYNKGEELLMCFGGEFYS